MKLQLDEQTLNAYINEAIKQELGELDEGIWNRVASFAGKKVADKAAKSAGKVAARKATAKASRDAAAKGSRTLVGASRKAGVAARDVNRYNKALIRAGKVDAKEVKQLRNLQKLQRQGKLTPEQTKELRKLESRLSGKGFYTNRADAQALLRARGQQAAIAGGAAALGGAYALGRGTANNDPDAPWNDGQDGGNENDGWDGTFPWDNTDPEWTPRPTRNPQPAPTQTPEPAQPETPARPEMPRLEPVALPASIPTGVTLPADQQPGIIGRPQVQPTFAQNAVGTMVRTAMANPADVSQREKNNGLRTIKRNAVRTINGDSYTGDKKADTKLVRDMYRTIRRGDQHPTL